MPRVSVIVPAYNHERFVGECIASVLAQTFSDFEIVVVDDASTDATADVVRRFTDGRIRLFVNERNRGACAAANACLAEARGEYIAMLSSDDAWEPQKLALQVALLDARPELGAVFSCAEIVGEDGRPVEDRSHFAVLANPPSNRPRHQWLRSFFADGNSLCHPSALVRVECYHAIGGYLESMAQLPDLDFWVRLCSRYEIHVIDEPLLRFRVLAGEMNASAATPVKRRRMRLELGDILRRYALLPPAEIAQVFPEHVAAGADAAFIVACACLAVGSHPETGAVHRDVGISLLRSSLASRSGSDPWSWTWPVDDLEIARILPSASRWLASARLPPCVVVALLAVDGGGDHASWGAHLLIDAFRPRTSLTAAAAISPLDVIRLTGGGGSATIEPPVADRLQVQLFHGGPDFAEERAVTRFVSPSPLWQRVVLTALTTFPGDLRLDPMDEAGAVEIREIALVGPEGRRLRTFSAATGFAGAAVVTRGVFELRGDSLLIVSADRDCQLHLGSSEAAPGSVEVWLRYVFIDRQQCLDLLERPPTNDGVVRRGLATAIRKLRELV